MKNFQKVSRIDWQQNIFQKLGLARGPKNIQLALKFLKCLEVPIFVSKYNIFNIFAIESNLLYKINFQNFEIDFVELV